MNKASLRSLILAAEFAVIIAVLSQFTIPLALSLNWTNICHRLNRYRFGQANGDLRYFNLLLIRINWFTRLRWDV